MARMHARRKGQSSSKKPLKIHAPAWIRYEKPELEAIISKLAKDGLPASQIGMRLRDVYGVPDVRAVIGKTVTQLLKEKHLAPELPEDLRALLLRFNNLVKHREANHKDMTSKRGQQLIEAKIRRLVRYYEANGMLPKGWKWDPKRVSLLVQ